VRRGTIRVNPALAVVADQAAYYRGEARRCRAMMRTAKTVAGFRRWAELADEYDQLAVALERSGRSQVQHMPMQQPQPVQQQQAKQKSK
jgi:hypothetical protein